MQIIRHHSTTDQFGSTLTLCAGCNPIIYQIILSRQYNGEPEHHYYDFTNNQLGEIDAYIRQMEDEWEAEKAADREIWWDMLCALPVEGEI